jgi:hypothetical protein
LTVQTFEEVRAVSIPEILANAILDADERGVFLPLSKETTNSQIVQYILHGLCYVGHMDRYHYWKSNFIVTGLLEDSVVATLVDF